MRSQYASPRRMSSFFATKLDMPRELTSSSHPPSLALLRDGWADGKSAREHRPKPCLAWRFHGSKKESVMGSLPKFTLTKDERRDDWPLMNDSTNKVG